MDVYEQACLRIENGTLASNAARGLMSEAKWRAWRFCPDNADRLSSALKIKDARQMVAKFPAFIMMDSEGGKALSDEIKPALLEWRAKGGGPGSFTSAHKGPSKGTIRALVEKALLEDEAFARAWRAITPPRAATRNKPSKPSPAAVEKVKDPNAALLAALRATGVTYRSAYAVAKSVSLR